jgi:hypothetical protein
VGRRKPSIDLLGENGSVMRRTLLVLVAMATLSSTVAGCDSGGPKPTADPTPTTTPSSTVAPATKAPRPVKNLCYAFSYVDAVASTTDVEPTSCKDDHTSRTFNVGTIDAVVDGHLLAVDSRQVRDEIAAQCPRRLGRFLGGSEEDRRLSMLRAVWFSPTIEESDAGQNWYRCDVIALAGDEELDPLGGRLKGVLDRAGAVDRYGMCGTADPEQSDFQRVICSAEHTWQAIATIDAKGQDYPGVARLRADGKPACEDPARVVAPDPLTVTWSYEPPTRDQWKSGQHYGICWAPASGQ